MILQTAGRLVAGDTNYAVFFLQSKDKRITTQVVKVLHDRIALLRINNKLR